MMNPDHSPASPSEFSDAAIGAIVALVRVVELYDPAVAHRACLRAIVATLMMERLDTSAISRQEVIAACALADIDLTVSRPADPESAHEPTRSLLGATIVGRLHGLRGVSNALGQQRERWDDGGDTLPVASRAIAVTDCLVGNPAAGFVPTWDHALRRIRRNRGGALDPNLCDALIGSALDTIEAPAIPSAVILELLEQHGSSAPTASGTETATTIRNAVVSAGQTSQLMTLFADTAQRTVSAEEVHVLQFGATQLDEVPIASATVGQHTAISSDLAAHLNEFSLQAELRAGVTVAPNGDDTADDHTATTLLIPIMVADQAWGVIAASRQGDAPFDDHDISILRHIASEAAVAVSSTTHWAQIEHMALRDQLTGLANRHVLYRVLDEIFKSPPLERIDTALIMCDVDGLKVVNDTLGHQAGDRLLTDAADALRGAVRDPSRTTVCRIGGDEFCMVIDGGALLTAHEISDMIERLFARSAGSGPSRSISCGIAFANDEITSRSALLRAADENQYQTKRARKAQVAAIENGTSVAEELGTGGTDRRAIRD